MQSDLVLFAIIHEVLWLSHKYCACWGAYNCYLCQRCRGKVRHFVENLLSTMQRAEVDGFIIHAVLKPRKHCSQVIKCGRSHRDVMNPGFVHIAAGVREFGRCQSRTVQGEYIGNISKINALGLQQRCYVLMS